MPRRDGLPHSLNGRDGDRGNDINRTAAAGQVINRPGKSLHDGPIRLGSRQTLRGFIAQVAGTQIREDKRVGIALARAVGCFLCIY